MKYCCPFQEVVGKRPQMSVYTSSKTFLALLAPNFLMFVCFPLCVQHKPPSLINPKGQEFHPMQTSEFSV